MPFVSLGGALNFVAKLLVLVASPATLLLLMAVSLGLAVVLPAQRTTLILVVLGSLVGFVALWRAKPGYAKVSYWLLGQLKARNQLATTGLILSRSIDFAEGRNPRYPQLRIAIQGNESGDMWNISIRNRGWGAVGPIHIGSADLARLIAPGWLAREIVDSVTLSRCVPEIATGVLLPFMGATFCRSKIPGFDAAAARVIATFFVHGGNELTSAMYVIDVEHPSGAMVARDPGPDMRLPPPTQVKFEYESSGYIPILAILSDGTPYTGKASGTKDIADWSGTFVDGKPDGEFSLTLGDRRQIRVRFKQGVSLD